MSKEEYSKIVAEIESLPQGGITYKKINGKEYAYYQWREDLLILKRQDFSLTLRSLSMIIRSAGDVTLR